jgi:hypothetical protein
MIERVSVKFQKKKEIECFSRTGLCQAVGGWTVNLNLRIDAGWNASSGSYEGLEPELTR